MLCHNLNKLDGVGPVDNRPSTISFTTLSEKTNKRNSCVTRYM